MMSKRVQGLYIVGEAMDVTGWRAAITSMGQNVAWPPPVILWRINEAPNAQFCPANRQIGKRRPPRQTVGFPSAKREALSAPPEVGWIKLRQTNDRQGSKHQLI